ncbi:VCBS repeat-containing protein [Poseidonocella pacifica]|uniref:VCBS repeat-containing protein n=1 Tax=Poseidonocella pacifica TaxID=871651 RepID=A0A1I0YCF3_9RHOB|nr:ExeM/NucH family extracellular endonuclease [Poseidonocella pacifica]SFB10446.1 VCBS repeat-containing protein [Poseidonocella pacifica]
MGFFWNAPKGGKSQAAKFRLNDIIFGSHRGDEIDSGMGYDTVFALGGDDIVRLGESGLVFGGWGNDFIFGGTGSLHAFGGFGNDTISLADGFNHIDGGHGFDTAVIAGSITEYSFTSRGRNTTILSSDSGTDVLKSIEALRFDDFTYYTDGRNNEVLASDDAVATAENDLLTIAATALLANDRDFDGDALSVTGVDANSTAGASVSFDGTNVTYTPGALFDGLAEGETATDSFTYQVSDGEGSIVSATVTVTIEGRNDAPVLATAANYDVAENSTAVVAALTASDAEGDALTYSLSGADAGFFTIDAATGALDFAVAPDFETPLNADGDNVYDLTVTVSDGSDSDSRDITVNVTDVLEINARINELHYDNVGGDTGEFVEVRVGAGQDASGLGVVLYNGANGALYNTLALPAAPTSTTGGYDYYLIELPSNGLQNGSPDGLALVHGTDVLEFLSYEGTLTATDGPAAGLTSTDIGVAESGSTLVGASLERAEDGDAWSVAETDTRGLNNDYEPPFMGRINEVHYDNAGGDIGEFVEVRVAAGTDVSGTTVELYNGANGSLYNTLSLTGLLASTSGGFDYYLIELPANGLQNGSPDGLALINESSVVEFLSYEGTFTATDGTAAGLTSTDIGVAESSSTEVGFSLQRNEDGDDWREADADTRGMVNTAAAALFVGRINELHYDNAGGDIGEFVEIRVAEGTTVAATTVELYNGLNGTVYNTLSLPGAPSSTSGGYDYYLIELPSNGLQNGSPDGLALINDGIVVEFLSYEGTLTAADGSAAGLTSTDIGVQETASTIIGHSLQRDETGDNWAEPAAETRGVANDATSDGDAIPAPYAFDFDTEFTDADWQAISVDGDAANTWYGSTFSGDGFAAVNAFGDSVAADDWLISPEIDISGLTNPVVSFANTKNFDDTGLADPEVTFLYSTDYSGSGDPSTATWIELPYSASTGSYAEASSGEIDLSGVPADAVHFAFRYQSSGTDGGSSSLWQIDDFSVGEATDSPPPPTETTLISTIQGSGSASFLETQIVTVEAIVVGDFQNGSAGVDGDLDGFYLQEEDADADGDLMTSEGIFVYEAALSLMNVQAGDLVRVTGTVAEFFNETQLTSISAIEVVSSGNQLPTAATITFPVANVTANSDGALIADLEAYEGMLVTVSQEMTVSDFYTLGRFGDIGLSAQGLVETFTQANTPDVAGFNAFIEEQVKNTLIIDDGSTIQNPSVIPFEIAGEPGRIAGEFDAEDGLSAGDTASGLTGVLRYSRASGGSGDEIYRLNLTQDAGFVDTAPRETDAPDVGGSLTVASFNVLNFFTSLGDEGLTSGPSGLEVRGAGNAEEYSRQLDKLVSAIGAMDADVIGLTELENEIGDQNGDGQFAIGALVDALNAADPAANYQYVDPGVDYVGSDAIMVGMIYDADTVRIAPGTTVEILTDADLAGLGVDPGNPVFEGSGTSRVPLAASFEEIASGEVFTVAVNHLKSKGSVSPFGDNAGIGDGTGNNNEARTQAAAAIDAWLDSDPTGSGDSDVLIIGDLNAYAKEDPITLLESEGYQNMVEEFLGADEFELSFGFPVDLDLAPQAQTFGALDHALASGSLSGQVTGAAEWRINALEAAVLDYNTDFAPADQVADLYGIDPYRSSDHDPLLIGLDLGGDYLA